MILLANAAGFFAALAMNFFYSGSETSLYRVSRVRLRVRQEEGDGRAGLVVSILDHLEGMVTAILIGNNATAYAGVYFLTAQLMQWRLPRAEILATAILTPVFFVLSESLPKQIAYNHADAWALASVRVLAALRATFLPAVWILNATSAGMRRLLGIKGGGQIAQSQRARLLEFFEAGVAENILSSDQTRMAGRIMELEGITASELMIPLSRSLLLPGRVSRARAAREMAFAGAEFALLTDGAGRATGKIITLNRLIRNPGAPDATIAGIAAELTLVEAGAGLSEVLLRLRQTHTQRVAVQGRRRLVGVITTQSILRRIAGIN